MHFFIILKRSRAAFRALAGTITTPALITEQMTTLFTFMNPEERATEETGFFIKSTTGTGW